MTLKLKKVHLQNWKCYQSQIIEFDLNQDKNIWIIFGLNGYGKTSLQEAILWCLYGNDGIAKNKLIKYFNRIANQQNPNLELLVHLDFQQGDSIYSISRVAKKAQKGTTEYVEVEEATFKINGSVELDPRTQIDAILPRSCKEFFFFDGEKIEEYAKFEHTQETRNAIESILGIPELKNLRDDARGALKKIDDKFKQADSIKNKLGEVTGQLTTLEHEIDTKKAQLKLAIQDYQQELKILADVRERANQNKDLQNKLDRLTEKKLEQKSFQEKLKNSEEEVEKALKQSSIPLLLEFVREMADELQSKTTIDNRIYVSTTQLEDILQADTCICGRCIDDNIRQYFLKQLEDIKKFQTSTEEILSLQNIYAELKRISRYQPLDLNRILSRRDEIEENIELTKQEINRLKQDTKDINHETAQKIWTEVGKEEQLVKEKEQKIERLRQGMEQLNKQKDGLRRKKEELVSRDREMSAINKQYKIAEGLYQAANELIEWHIQHCQETIENRTSQLHRSVTNKPNEYIEVKIKADYTLGVKNKIGETLNPETLSAGEKQVLAFAFIAGLNLASSTAAPLVIDTPFGRLDGIHKKNIVNSLPQIPSQVIILATDEDLPDNLLQELRPHIAQIHNIRRLGENEDASAIEVEE
jgi:DNA sulfur modification protein DndD